ncbi:hypothetical protein LVJ94_42225 [Pendulispora rubella]|uniref:Tetratricopeptide repeat protein n=1 Tax=Pendulispora rubella TaxID=2741070 RepID=A0ABZ2L1S0_9BACT
MDSYVLLGATIVFAVYLIFRFRPALSGLSRGGARSAARAALKDAKTRLDAAKTDEERALCLGDAGDASASAGRTNGAVGYYIRAMRLDPRSAALIERAATHLEEHPHALETLLWRRLGAESWTGPTAAPAHAALRHLAKLYAHGALRQSVRARVFRNALAAVAPSTESEEANPAPRAGLATRDDGSAPANP